MYSFKDFTKLTSDDFKVYINSLNIDQKVKLLELLEIKYRFKISKEYFVIFEEYNIQLLLESITEISTRLNYIHQDITKS
jgi:hypothetical protein